MKMGSDVQMDFGSALLLNLRIQARMDSSANMGPESELGLN